MFPNPQDALPLPPHALLADYEAVAARLIESAPQGIGEWAAEWVESVARDTAVARERSIDDVDAFARRTLATDRSPAAARLVIARSHGFESWRDLAEHVEALQDAASSIARFEAAADAIVSGDDATLTRLLRDDRELSGRRSTREHRAALLHYVSANGVEGFRQRSPHNAPRIARMLLDAGAEVEAEANVYGGGCTTLRLVATSVHPERAGVAEELMQLLIDRGAALDDKLVRDCLANGRPRAAAFLADRGAPLTLAGAAGIGRLDVVNDFLARGAAREEIQRAFLFACEFGHTGVAELLLDRGAELGEQLGTQLTALHWAVVGGHVTTIRSLLARGADLEAVNGYGGTPLEQAGWSLVNGDPDADWPSVFATLLAAGAKFTPGWLSWLEQQRIAPSMKERIATLLRQYGAST